VLRIKRITQAVAEEAEGEDAGGSEHLFSFTDALAPVVGTTFGVGDGYNHDLAVPRGGMDVKLITSCGMLESKLRRESICAATQFRP